MGRPARSLAAPRLADMDALEAVGFLIDAALSEDQDTFDAAVGALLELEPGERFLDYLLPVFGVAWRRGPDACRAVRRLQAAVESIDETNREDPR